MTSGNALPVKVATPDDHSQLDRFWANLLGRDWDDRARRRCAWLESRRVHYIVKGDRDILGNATLLRQPFLFPNGERHDVGWITDFFVSPKLKGQGMGKRLARRLAEGAHVVATFGQSQDARYCFTSLGWQGPEWTSLLARGFPAMAIPRRRASTWERVSLDDQRLEAVWERRGARCLPLGIRDGATLRARLAGRPDAQYESWLLSEKGEPDGWIILRLIRGDRNRQFGRVPVGLIVDVFAAGDRVDVLRELIRRGARRLGVRGALAVLAVETPGPTGVALRQEGFRPRIGLGPVSRGLPRRGFMHGSGNFEGMPHLSFLDCDSELTF